MIGQLKRYPARLTKNGENFAFMTTFELENIDPRSRPLPPSLVFLALLGAKIARGDIMPPSRARNSQTLSTLQRVLNNGRQPMGENYEWMTGQ